MQKTKEEITSNDCKHEIGWSAIGGFLGHEHIHTTGEQICLKCKKTLNEIVQIIKKESYCNLLNEMLTECNKTENEQGRLLVEQFRKIYE
jgi:hypothetical protein